MRRDISLFYVMHEKLDLFTFLFVFLCNSTSLENNRHNGVAAIHTLQVGTE